jgi:2'-5' RNA ligase
MGQQSLRAGGLSAAAPRQAGIRSTIRCFVALLPDEAARDRLDQLAQQQQARFAAARRMRRENFHLTLAFIGALETAVARRVAARLATETFEAFDWALDALGAFGRARVLWAGGVDARLEALACRARGLLETLDVPHDRKPFVAHVTLLRKLPRVTAGPVTTPIAPPILWQVSPPVLLQSTTDRHGARYTPLPARGEHG